ncbi:hypothetical protein [Dongia sp.]|uniref:hypothetical protein n=1 Tax=Dongia sp. TaxID=1977262 RepID=UPI003752E94C
MSSIAFDRTAQMVMASDSAADYHDARRRLDSASIKIRLADGLAEARWAQAALLVMISCGSRMFPRGVFLELNRETRCNLPLYANRTLARVCEEMGAKFEDFPDDALAVQIGSENGGDADLYCGAVAWTASVSARPLAFASTANELSGALSGALAISAAFRARVLGDPLALRRDQTLSLWEGGDAPEIKYLPTALWFLGLGNLGQAALLLLSFLPYADAGAVQLLLQDFDSVGPENISVQVLTRPAWLGKQKARVVADWAETMGFQAKITERRFTELDGPSGNEPRTAIVGVDNLDARRSAATAPFTFVIDAGLGATGPEAFDLRLHAFPGARSPATAWPELPPDEPVALTPALESLVREGAISRCGAMMIAGKSVGVPCTAIAAAALQLTQVVRAISGAGYADMFDVSLRDCKRAVHSVSSDRPVIPFQRALSFDSRRTRPA